MELIDHPAGSSPARASRSAVTPPPTRRCSKPEGPVGSAAHAQTPATVDARQARRRLHVIGHAVEFVSLKAGETEVPCATT